VACDNVIFRKGKRGLEVLLIKRGYPPFKGRYALPGGFLEWGESCERAAARELKEETSLNRIKLERFGVFSAPGRDPRGTVISIGYLGFAGAKQKAISGDDAAAAEWFMTDKIPPLAFDHGLMLKEALKYIRQKRNLTAKK
jgi:8-oxo-dGTP diphosphatase